MATILVRHKVTDFPKWKAIYDEGKTKLIKPNGGKRQRLFKNSADPNELVILTEFDDMAKAKKVGQSDELKQFMQRGGVADEPTVLFLEEAEDAPL